jgi:hypothetical protein
VEHTVSALERAFQLARSGRVAKVDDIKKQLKKEGYDASAMDGGPTLGMQLRKLGRVDEFWRNDVFGIPGAMQKNR